MLRAYDPEEVIDLAQDFDADGRPVNTPAPAMSEATVRTLAGAEYDFCRIDAMLSDLRKLLRRAAPEAPRCRQAARKVQAARLVLRHALDALDADLTQAVKTLELLAPPPF
jgi:hypothetical protein